MSQEIKKEIIDPMDNAMLKEQDNKEINHIIDDTIIDPMDKAILKEYFQKVNTYSSSNRPLYNFVKEDGIMSELIKSFAK